MLITVFISYLLMIYLECFVYAHALLSVFLFIIFVLYYRCTVHQHSEGTFYQNKTSAELFFKLWLSNLVVLVPFLI